MISLAKIEANRRNARRSTGPRTAEGKAIVAGNAIRHGIFALLPVVPGENPYDWEQHRAGIVAALAPAGLLEVTLAERAALLLWQLARLGRFQATIITAAVEDAGLPLIEADPFGASLRTASQQEEQHMKFAEQNLRMDRKSYAEDLAVVELCHWLGKVDSGAVQQQAAHQLLGWMVHAVEDYPLRQSHPLHITEPEFLSRIGAVGTCYTNVNWTTALLVKALEYYASVAGESTGVFRTNLQAMIEQGAAARMRRIKRLELEAAGMLRRSEKFLARATDVGLLPPEQIAERMMKYEKLLHGMLTSTLHEMERLQARRGGMRVIPPIVADIHFPAQDGPA